MEHACYKCGTSVEDGIAFCPQCNAPQIHVSTVPEVEVAAAPQSALEQVGLPSHAIQWSQGLPAAALAGLISAILMPAALGVFGLGLVAAGALAVMFYRRRNPAAHITPGVGARLGAVSGILGFGLFSIFEGVKVLVFHRGGELRAAILQAIQQSAARTSDPQALQMLDYLKTDPGIVVMIGFSLFVMFAVFVIFLTLGGAIGAALLRAKDRG